MSRGFKIIEEIEFDQIKKIWQEKLWPSRRNVRPVQNWNLIDDQFEIMPDFFERIFVDKTITKKYEEKIIFPKFWGAYDLHSEKLIGVNSGFLSNEKFYRSRGLWVDPHYRNQGVAGYLLWQAIAESSNLKCEITWSAPRKEALSVYQRAGFQRATTWLTADYGENCIAIRYKGSK